MASVIVKILFLFVGRLVVPTAAEDGLKTAGTITCQLDTTVQSPLDVKSSLKGSLTETTGPFKGALKGPLWPLSAARSWDFEKKHGAFTCTLSSSGKTPTGSITGSTKVGGANVKGTMSTPAEWPMKPSGSVEVKKSFGDLSCTLKSVTFPLKPRLTELEKANLGTVSLGQKIQGFDCSLTGTVSEGGGKLAVGNGKVSVKRSVDTPIGPVCGVLDTSIDAPTKAVGTVSLKKTLGKVCCNLKATSKGAVTCTFESKAEGLLDFKSEVSPDGGFMTIPVVAFIGFALGGIITFNRFRPVRATLTAGEQQLLA